jgi:ankyrin repeat protein
LFVFRLICLSHRFASGISNIQINQQQQGNFEAAMSDKALRDAAREGMLEEVKQLVEAGANVVAADERGWTALHEAIFFDRDAVAFFLVEQLIKRHPPGTLDVPDKEGRSPLMFAAMRGMLDVVKQLVAAGADVVAADAGGETVLHHACRSYGKEAVALFIIELLIKRDPPVPFDARDNEGVTPLMLAAGNGMLEVVKQLVAGGADAVAADAAGKTVLHHACSYYGREAVALFIIEQLIKRNALGTLDAPDDKFRTTPLELAARKGMLGVVTELVGRGADVGGQGGWESTVLNQAIFTQHEAVALFLADDLIRRHVLGTLHGPNNKGRTLLMSAAEEGMRALVKVLVEWGADVMAADQKGRTALHYAILARHEAVALFLIDQHPPGALDIPDNKGGTPFMWAAHKGMLEAVEKLVARGVNMVATSAEGLTALHCAIINENEAVALRLIEHLIDRNLSAALHAPTNLGRTPLMLAAEEGMLDVVKALVAAGADVTAADAEGYTALHHAIRSNQEAEALDEYDNEGDNPLMLAAEERMLDVVKALVAAGADVMAADGNGNTALHHAIRSKHEAVALFLIERQPPGTLDVRDDKGNTPLMLAAKKGMLDTVKKLVAWGADMVAADAGGFTALLKSIIYVHEAVAIYLIDQHLPGVLNMHEEGGLTPLMCAAIKGMLDTVEALVAAGADMEAADQEGRRVLHHAIRSKNKRVALFLIQRGCDVRGQGQDRTPFMLAVDHGLEDVGDMLLSKGAVDLDQLDDFDVDDYDDTVEFLRPIMARSLAVRRLYKALRVSDTPQAMRRAREEAARQGMPPEEQEEKALAAAPTCLRGRVEGNRELPTAAVPAAEGSVRTLVATHLAEEGLTNDLVGELMDMLLPLSDSARRGKPLGHMIEQWEGLQGHP